MTNEQLGALLRRLPIGGVVVRVEQNEWEIHREMELISDERIDLVLREAMILGWLTGNSQEP